jgi:hypothetical protein
MEACIVVGRFIEEVLVGNPALERAAFRGFLDAEPLFAGEAISEWDLAPSDPPDVLCKTSTGRRVGLELTGWLNEDQIAAAKGIDAAQGTFLRAIAPEPPNDTEEVGMVWLSPRAKARVKPADAGPFRAELLRLVQDVDAAWSKPGGRPSPQGERRNVFSQYPMLARYLEQVKFFPRYAFGSGPFLKGGRHWLTFPCRGGAYSSEPMVEALKERIADKVGRYGQRPGDLEEFDLLVHYDLAWEYNTPVETPAFSYADAASEAADFIDGDPGVFDKIFVFVPHAEGKTVFRVYPR